MERSTDILKDSSHLNPEMQNYVLRCISELSQKADQSVAALTYKREKAERSFEAQSDLEYPQAHLQDLFEQSH